MNIRVILADDHRMMREGLKSLLDEEQDIQVVAQAKNGRDIVALAAETGAHVVIMDVAMPDLNGIEATRQIIDANPNTKVVALSGHENKGYVKEMLTAGASAYVLKKRAYEELVTAVREAMRGRKFLSPDIARGVVDDYVELSATLDSNPAFVVLTDRERQVLQEIAEGRATRETADNLNVSVKTIETHRRNIMQKLNLHSVAELTKYAIREGITSID
jgi:DNA-binding NarL/FixJ family response regulator